MSGMADAPAPADGSGRKLKPQGSCLEAPDKKQAKIRDDQERDDNKKAEELDEDMEDRTGRTITFGTFPEDIKATEIVTFIGDALKEVEGELGEILARGKKFAERGGARLKTAESMRDYIGGAAARRRRECQGKRVYCNVGSKRQDQSLEEVGRGKAARKVARTIIEANGGGGGDSIKRDIDANFKKGIAWWKEKRVAVWTDGQMKLFGDAAAHQGKFDELHGK
ncbi:unnamed protein product, partial [Prorocentrum cordatum]